MAFLLLGNKIGGINDITANHQCAFKTGYGTFTEKPAYQHNNREEAISTLKSRLFIFPIGSGDTVALHPSTKNILNRLLPMTLPIAIPGFFFKAAVTDVASSGKEVPPATNVSPITDSLTPHERASPLAPSTKSCPPNMSPASPPAIYNTDFHTAFP